MKKISQQKTQIADVPYFKRHLVEVGESYFQHARHAVYFSWHCLLMSVASFIHALLPFVFEKTASNKFQELSLWLKQR